MPGLIFVIKEGTFEWLPCMSQLRPPLTQGANPSESRKNLYSWLDVVARELNLPPIMFVYDLQEQREPGLYHRMKSDEVERFVGELTTRLQDWEAYCIANDKSCGVAMRADGKGTGKVTLTTFKLGPFRG